MHHDLIYFMIVSKNFQRKYLENTKKYYNKNYEGTFKVVYILLLDISDVTECCSRKNDRGLDIAI